MLSSNVIYYGLCGVVLSLMATDDWKECEIPEWKCLIGWFITILTFRARSGVLWLGVLICALAILYFLPFTASFFGDADYIPLCIYLAYFGEADTLNGLNVVPLLMSLITLLIILFPYAHIYYKCHGGAFKLFSGMAVPMLPAFAIAWWCSGVYLILWEYFGSI